ncbi:SGNH hydrolase-type esterase domain-containing protein [Mycena maculata]|uniref:SGNH hydrolase-type esterase domain-containing protein n=1 Tax=Mycena maculata TaxID=230809 RepID=A0AAD7IJV5_9AGAR|nr:SGNH hydrolase-type esterase domain-containing protein [Mycena maculata]
MENMVFNDTTSAWPGYKCLKNLFIFGDSYSAIGFAANLPPPTKVDRKSVPFQGLTYADEDGTNWVGYLLTQHDPHPDLLVHDYAVGGARVPALGRGGAVETQVNTNFLEGYAMAATPEGLPWDAVYSLFVTWVGINDCAYSQTHTETLQLLFSLEEKLYAAGARLFLFIDVPPIGRAPACINSSSERDTTYTNWNTELRQFVTKFAAAHPDARVLSFSAFDSFNRLLDDPKKHGFDTKDVRTAWGPVWRDQLHPTSRVHEIFARDLVTFLESVDAPAA